MLIGDILEIMAAIFLGSPRPLHEEVNRVKGPTYPYLSISAFILYPHLVHGEHSP